MSHLFKDIKTMSRNASLLVLGYCKKWCYATTCAWEYNTIYFKRVLYPLKDFHWRQYFFKVLLHLSITKEIVQSLKRMPHHFMQCVRYSTLSKEYCIPLGTFLTVTGKTLSKYCCIYWSILLQRSVTKKCYMFSKKSPTIHPIVSVFQFILGLSGKVCGKSKDVGGMSHCSGTQWLKKNFFNLASLDSRFNI